MLKNWWCGHEVQAPHYTNVQEEEQREDGPTCGLMDGAYQLLGLRLNKPKHLIIRVSLCIFIVSYLSTFLIIVRQFLRIIKKTCVFFHWCRLQFCLVLTPSSPYVLTPRVYLFFVLLLVLLCYIGFGIRADFRSIQHNRRQPIESKTIKRASQAQVLTPRSYPFILLLFNFVLVVLCQLVYGILAWFQITCICAHKHIYELYSCFLAAISRHIVSSDKHMQQM